jgi:hypothetical protein
LSGDGEPLPDRLKNEIRRQHLLIISIQIQTLRITVTA